MGGIYVEEVEVEDVLVWPLSSFGCYAECISYAYGS